MIFIYKKLRANRHLHKSTKTGYAGAKIELENQAPEDPTFNKSLKINKRPINHRQRTAFSDPD